MKKFKTLLVHHKWTITIILIFTSILLDIFFMNIKSSPNTVVSIPPTPTITSAPTPTPVQTFVQPKISVKQVYNIALLGDSMTAALGPHGGKFSEYMNTAYKDAAGIGIIVDNYAVPSTNIQSLQKRFTEPMNIDGKQYPAIRDRKDLDLIIIESFTYNPLSQLSENQSALEHGRELKHILEEIHKELPNTRVALMSTIAPNSKRFAVGVEKMNGDDRVKQVAERITYLQRHIELAGIYALPIINVYELSLKNGDGNIEYINPDDNIHPSAVGIEFISRTMEQFTYNQRIFPIHDVIQ